MRLRFRFSTVPFAATVLLVALGIALGNWQMRRAFEKTALQAQLDQRTAAPPLALGTAPVDPASIEFRRVIVTGEFVPNWPLFLDNRPQDGRTGFVVLMPFKIRDAQGSHGTDRHVLVARGWVPRGAGRHDQVPPVATPSGLVTIEGIAVRHPARVMQLGSPAPLRPGAILQNVEVAEVARASGLALQPFLVEQTSADPEPKGAAGAAEAGKTAAALVRKWPAPALDVERHKGYAFQWYALAAMAFLFFVMTGFRSGTRQAGSSNT